MKREDHEKFVASLDEIQEAIMDSFNMDTEKFMGTDCVVYKGMTGDALWEDPECILGEELLEKAQTENGEEYPDLNENFNRIQFPKDSIYVHMGW